MIKKGKKSKCEKVGFGIRRQRWGREGRKEWEEERERARWILKKRKEKWQG